MQADIDNEQLTISLLFPTNSLRTHLQKFAESSQKVSLSFPKISRQFFDYIPKLVDIYSVKVFECRKIACD